MEVDINKWDFGIAVIGAVATAGGVVAAVAAAVTTGAGNSH
jgi:hypothetical protein